MLNGFCRLRAIRDSSTETARHPTVHNCNWWRRRRTRSIDWRVAEKHLLAPNFLFYFFPRYVPDSRRNSYEITYRPHNSIPRRPRRGNLSTVQHFVFCLRTLPVVSARGSRLGRRSLRFPRVTRGRIESCGAHFIVDMGGQVRVVVEHERLQFVI